MSAKQYLCSPLFPARLTMLKKHVWLTLFFLVLCFPAVAAPQEIETLTPTIDQRISDAFEGVSNQINDIVFYSVKIFGDTEAEVSFPLILLWLVMASLFFTLYLGFINIRGFAHGIKVLKGDYDPKATDGKKHVNRIEILSTALSGTVGLGNIAGVAVAISVGGPGAIVWMTLMGFFGMSTKFAEAVLGVKYRHITKTGRIMGGPMYYLTDGFAERGWKKMGRFLAILFAVCCVGGSLGAGGMFQANQAHAVLVSVTGGAEGEVVSFMADKGWVFGLLIAFLVGLVIVGGFNQIAHVAGKIVPFMGFLYVGTCAVILFMHADAVGPAFWTILSSSFTAEAGLGGFIGALIMGVQRAAFSNEAGIGSAAIAHAPTETDRPISEGFVGMLEPFIDTIIICNMTALVIVVTGVYTDADGMQGVSLTKRAFEETYGHFQYLLALAVNLFAFSTMISWSYYGSKSFSYLLGKRGETRAYETGFRIFYCLCIVVGASANLQSVIGFTDAMVFTMAIPNIIGLYVLAPSLRREMKEYWSHYKHNAKPPPVEA